MPAEGEKRVGDTPWTLVFIIFIFWNSLGTSEWDGSKNSLKLDTTELLFLAQPWLWFSPAAA